MRLKLDIKGFNYYADKVRDTDDVHDRIHDAYEGKLGEEFKEKTRKRIDWIVKKTKSKKVLDVGCSQGTVPILLGRSGLNVLGVDIDAKAIDAANLILKKEPPSVKRLVRFQNKDFLGLDFREEKFDTIIFSELLEHLSEPEVFIKKAHALAANRGKLVVTVPFGINDHPDHRQVFYLGEIYSMISKYFVVKDAEVIGKWIGIAAEKNNQPSVRKSIGKDYIAYEEHAFYRIERDLEEKLKTLKGANKTLSTQLRENRQRLIETTRMFRKTSDDLMNVRNSRAYRIVRLFIDAVKRPRRFIKFPYRLLKVMIARPLVSSPYVNDFLNGVTVGIRRGVPGYNLKDISRTTDKKIKVASILDDFSYSSFSPECDILQLKPKSWQVEMDEFQPDMLLVESAWRGVDDQWQHLVANMSKDLDLILRYCQERNIPTVFWCKEDPVHFDRFINTAKYFDFIFTSDNGSVDKYKKIVNHDRVYTLRFAAQPILMNPIEKYDRKNVVCFAGTYYVKYQHRVKEFNEIVDELLKNKYGVAIYDRNYNRGDPNYFYPDKYQKYVQGTLSFEDIDLAYKGYKYALTMNTIQNSTTMFARRAYELLASNTVTISNYCLGIKTQLGDLVISGRRGQDIVKKFKDITSNELYVRKFKLMGLREVLNHHTYDIRLSEVCSVVFDNYQRAQLTPAVSVIAEVHNQRELYGILQMFDRQNYKNKKLALLAPKNLAVPKGVQKLSRSAKINSIKNVGDYILVANQKNYYGVNFLLDMMLATKYSDKTTIGKSSYYEVKNNKLILKNDRNQYHEGVNLIPGACIIKTSGLKEKKLSDLLSGLSKIINEQETLSIDEFSYCQDGANLSQKQISEIEGHLEIDTGIGGSPELTANNEHHTRA